MLKTRTIRLACLAGCLVFARPALAADGDLDPTFGTGGKVVTGFDLPAAGARAVAMQADGKILVAGWVFNLTGILGWAVARYNPDGSLDPTFDFDGKVQTTFLGGNDTPTVILLQPDAKILVGGTITEGLQLHFAVVRYLPDGRLDPSFDGDGRAIATFFSVLGAMVLQPDGKVVLAGSAAVGGPDGDFALSRYNADGTLDTAFGTSGTVLTDFAGLDEGASSLLLLSSGKLLAVGSTESNVSVSDTAFVRYDADGSLDLSFGIGGKVISDVSGRADDAFDAVLQPDGKVVVSGNFNPTGFGGDLTVARFLADGTVDPDFGSGGISSVGLPGSDEAAYAVAMQADGKIVVAGIASGLGGYYDFALARFNAGGSPDESFGPLGARVVTDFFGRGDGATAILVQPDGRIVAAGGANGDAVGYMALGRYLGSPVTSSPPACPRSYGYWRSHPAEWPIPSLVLGSQSYGTAELAALLHSPTKGDASVILARQLIAAKLNLAAGAGTEELVAEVATADALLAGFPGRLPYDVSPSSASGRDMVKLAGRLASTTNRGARAGCGEVKLPK